MKCLRPSSGGPRALIQLVSLIVGEDPGFDEIYCVLDHDGRQSEVDYVRRELARIGAAGEFSTCKMILSDPCFEYWLLLHFRMTNRPFQGSRSGPSACDQVITELRQHLPGYRKNDYRVFGQCAECLDDAIQNAESIRRNLSFGSPHTDVGLLVSRLLSINV